MIENCTPACFHAVIYSSDMHKNLHNLWTINIIFFHFIPPEYNISTSGSLL
nr:MAG TPA: hypothetical protein [Caudoviricetes sp.]